nr:hypothetical protein CFP56_04045 [Quercus suber]
MGNTDGNMSSSFPDSMALYDHGYKVQNVLKRFFPVSKTASSKKRDNILEELYVSDSQEVKSTTSDEGEDAGKGSEKNKYVHDNQEGELAIFDEEEASRENPAMERGYCNIPTRTPFVRGSSAPRLIGGVSKDAFNLVDENTAQSDANQTTPRKYQLDLNRDEINDRFAGVKVCATKDEECVVKIEPSPSPKPSCSTNSANQWLAKTPEGPEVIDLSDDEDESTTGSEIGNQDSNTGDHDERAQSEPSVGERSRHDSKQIPSEDRGTASSGKEVIDLLETENEKNKVEGSSAKDKAHIEDLESAITQHTATIKRQRDDIRELGETLADVAEESKVANKMVTLRRQHKNALTALRRANHENMTKLRESTTEKIDAIKAEYEDRKETMRKQFNDRISTKDRAVQKARISLDVLKEQTKEKLEEAKAKAAEARTQKTQNNADIEALKKQLREEHAEELLSCRPENNRRIQERDEQIKALKVQIRELEKANGKCKADVATLHDSLKEEVKTRLQINHDRDEMCGKYRKYKSFAIRLDAELKAQATKHGEDKAEMVARAEEKTFQQEQKWSLQWNIAQQKSGEVVGLNRMVSELRDGQGRKDAVIRDLRRRLLAVDGKVVKPRDKKPHDEAATVERRAVEEEEEDEDDDEAEERRKQKKSEDEKYKDELSGVGAKRKAVVLVEEEIKRRKIES